MGDGQNVPKNVARVRIHLNDTKIDQSAFKHCRMKEVVFNEGYKKSLFIRHMYAITKC